MNTFIRQTSDSNKTDRQTDNNAAAYFRYDG